jgi:ABC-2 type transport system ATP-binding protein
MAKTGIVAATFYQRRSGESLLSIQGLCFSYHGQQPQLDQLHLSVQQGDILGLLGPNGAGKTTLVSLIAGLLQPHAGSITVAGKPVRLGQKNVALVPQEYAFYGRLSGRENLLYFAGINGLRGRSRDSFIDTILADCGLTNLQHKRADAYSGGLKRRLNFAIALLQQPQLLILDEPTANVDPQSRAFLLDIVHRLNREGVTIIYTSHLMAEVESLCRTVAVMDAGKIVLTGSMSELLAEQQRLLVVHLANPLPQHILTLPGVVARNTLEYAFDLTQLAHTPASLLVYLEQAGITPQQIHFGQRRLEEVFFASTHRELRE